MRKLLQIAGTLLLVGGVVPTAYGLTRYEIPATQEEFESQWEIVAGEDSYTWEWVNATTPYAQISPSNSAQAGTVKGATLVYKQPIEMRAGETYYLQANGCSADYNDDERFYFVVGTDKENMTPFKTSSSSFYWYRSRNLEEPNFQIKPTDTSDDRKFTPTEDGVYYIGIRSWYAVGSFANKKLQVQALLVDKLIDCPDRVTSTSAKMNAEGALEATVAFTMPTKTIGGVTITGNLSANIYRSTENTKEALTAPSALIATLTDLEAGQKVTFEDNAENSSAPIPAAGKYYYYVAPINDNGENTNVTSATTIELKWVGEDSQCYNPLSADITVKSQGDNIVLVFKNRTTGYNGGYIDTTKLYNIIKRQKNGGEWVIIEEHYPFTADENGLTTYVDSTLDGLGTYKYEISAGYGDYVSPAAASPAIFGGGSMTIPFAEDFSDASTFANYTVETSNSSNKWQRTGENVKFHPGYSSYSTVTSTLFTPPLKMEAGKTYKVSAKIWGDSQSSGSSSYPGYWGDDDWDDYYDDDESASYPFKFVAGSAPQLSGANVFGNMTIDVTSKSKTFEAFFAPTETGSYYIGFSTTSSDSECVYLDDISIELSEVLPAAVADLAVAPAQDGTNSAAITFTAPLKSNAGVDLTSLTKIVVNRYAGEETEEVKVIEEDLTPGMAVSFTDEAPEAGMYSYGVICYIDDKSSDEAKSEAKWLGYDVPKQISAYSGLSVALNSSYIPVITWSALSGTTITEHGGYVDRDNLKYRVYRLDQVNADNEPAMVGETAELTFTDASINEAEWSRYRYGIAVVNGSQEGKRTECFTTITGGEVDAEHELDLTNESYVTSFEGRGFIHENGISWKNRGETEGTEHIAYLPPFRYVANETNGVKVNMTVSRGHADYEELLEVYLCTLETEAPDLRNEGEVNTEAAEIAGHANMTLVQTVPVHAMSDEPEAVVVPVAIPENGKYRLALRCASADNKQVTVHSLAVAPFNNEDTGIEEINVNNVDCDATYYTLQGVAVKNPEAGIYIRVKNGKAAKVMINR